MLSFKVRCNGPIDTTTRYGQVVYNSLVDEKRNIDIFENDVSWRRLLLFEGESYPITVK